MLGSRYVSANTFQSFLRNILITKDTMHDEFCINYDVMWDSASSTPPTTGGFVDLLHPRVFGALSVFKFNVYAIDKLKQNLTPFESAASSLAGALNSADYPTSIE